MPPAVMQRRPTEVRGQRRWPSIPPSLRWLALVVAVHLTLGLAYDWATPVFEASDEGAHFAVVHALAAGRGLPVQDAQRPDQAWAQEGSQPPLYYGLAAMLVSGIDQSDFDRVFVQNPLSHVGIPGTSDNANLYRHPLVKTPLAGTVLAVRSVRWFSLGLSLVTIALAHRLSLAISPGRHWLALLTASFVAFNPMVLFINASVNNDNLLMLLSTAALLLAVQVMRPGQGDLWRRCIVLGAMLGLAALTKVSGLVLWPVAGLGVLIGVLREGRAGATVQPGSPEDKRGRAPDARREALLRLGKAAGRLAVVFGLAVVICGWWYWRNYQLYGDWLGLNTMVAIAGAREPTLPWPQLVAQEWRGFFMSFWAVFGAFTILPAPWVIMFYDGLTLWAIAGGLWLLVRRPRWPEAEPALLGLFCALTLAGVVRWTMLTQASQGRLLFGAIAPLALFLAAGILTAARPQLRMRAGRDWAGGLTITLSGALALVAGVIPSAFIAPRYTPPPRLTEPELPADLRPVHALFGDSIELVGYTSTAEAVRPGDRLPVTLYWRSVRPVPEDWSLALHLFGREMAPVGRLDTWPGGGLAPTGDWIPGMLFADTYYLAVADDAVAPARLLLDVYFWDRNPLVPLSLTGPDGRPVTSVNFPVGRLVPAPPPSYQPEHLNGSTFEHGIELVGYDLSTDGALYLTLYWRLTGDERVPADYTVFLHVTDAQGLPVMEPADGPPVNGDWPTSAWEPGQTVADNHLVALPPNLGPGHYALQLGLYDPVSGVRLRAFKPDGTPWPDDAVILPGFQRP